MNRLFLVTTGLFLLAAACKPPKLDAYEKNLEIPGHDWTYDYKPFFEITLQPEDTANLYDIAVNVRHTDAYPYSNIWVMIGTQYPGDSVIKEQRVELQLAELSGKWLGTGLDDIYERRIPIQQKAIFNKPGTYRFTFEQNMRQNPLPHVMNVGLRIEKAGKRP
ncbi:gliding motility lipoprotein GldH [Chitinophaga nivalis]|uniref:Gliding motility lipoprotein GldH n=1 Tax=Chitinophaga nivalis TaxID=2991709 RepID=A0ABT3IV43_9BACT|nr:gliding motility lipoprotein GldH [Chitinophaga nivalis]MCW3462479.1 gliding motility lipoprotein GldH [Chitinophaga nivalis]MCW3487830.1 gliding motility lipoprotein GldH [Chitinophaga nivalis]